MPKAPAEVSPVAGGPSEGCVGVLQAGVLPQVKLIIKLKEGRFRLDVRRKSFTQRVLSPWHCCPGQCGWPISGGAQAMEGALAA